MTGLLVFLGLYILGESILQAANAIARAIDNHAKANRGLHLVGPNGGPVTLTMVIDGKSHEITLPGAA